MRNRVLMMALATAGTTMGFATPASAQATRTWVSGTGDDVNPCSRTAPCKTFAGAISKTAAGGEINCLDPGGYGAVTITKSMTISCPYTEGGALAGGNGIVINDSATATPNTAVVFIRGLDIFGVSPPSNGIRFVSGAALYVEDTTVRRFNSTGYGISFQPAGAAQLFVRNTTITENGSGASGGGILIQPTGAAGSAKAVLDDVRLSNNANQNIRVDTNGSTGAGANVLINDTTMAGSATGLSINGQAGTANVAVMLTDSRIYGATTVGLNVDGAAAVIRVGNTTITNNTMGVNVVGGAISNSFGNNRNFGNPMTGLANNGSLGSIVAQN
jgi:hypothetical protein